MYIIRRLDERPRPATAPGDEGRMTEPAPGGPDDLAPRPRSDAGPRNDVGEPVYGTKRTPRREKVLNLSFAQAQPEDDDDRIINLDGQDVPARTGAQPRPNQPATRRTGTGAQPGTTRQPGTGARPGTGAVGRTGAAAAAAGGAQAGGGGFEFNDLAPPPEVRVIRIPLDELRKGDLRYNVVIRPRDTLYVPPAEFGTYYMGGHVVRPGAYSLSGQRVTLKQAIIAASMLDPLAIPQRTDVIRRLGPNREVWVRVNLAKLFAGRQPDVYIKPDDQVLVGTNLIAPYLAAFRNAFRFTYGAGFIYDRNFAYDRDVFGGGGGL
jgi:hypothetical protein